MRRIFRPEWRLRSCKTRWSDIGGFKKKHDTRRSWRRHSINCRQEKADVAVMLLSTTDAEPFVAMAAEQARQQFAILQSELNKVFDVPHQPTPATPVHVPGEQWGKGHPAAGRGEAEWEAEQRKSATCAHGRVPSARGSQ